MDAGQFQDRMQRIEELIAAIQEHANPVVRASAVELVRTLLDIHRAGLEQTLGQILRQGEPGQAILNELLQNDLVSRLLLLHGLHPVDLQTRLQRALDPLRARLRTLSSDVELISATHEAVELRVRGGSDDVHRLLEDAILAVAPDVLRIEFFDADASVSGLLSLPLVAEK
jgi:hypothetical protein